MGQASDGFSWDESSSDAFGSDEFSSDEFSSDECSWEAFGSDEFSLDECSSDAFGSDEFSAPVVDSKRLRGKQDGDLLLLPKRRQMGVVTLLGLFAFGALRLNTAPYS